MLTVRCPVCGRRRIAEDWEAENPACAGCLGRVPEKRSLPYDETDRRWVDDRVARVLAVMEN